MKSHTLMSLRAEVGAHIGADSAHFVHGRHTPYLTVRGSSHYGRNRVLAQAQRVQALKVMRAMHDAGYPRRVVAPGEPYGRYTSQMGRERYGVYTVSDVWKGGLLSNHRQYDQWLTRYLRTADSRKADADEANRFVRPIDRDATAATAAAADTGNPTAANATATTAGFAASDAMDTGLDRDFRVKRSMTKRKRARQNHFVDSTFGLRHSTRMPGRVIVLQQHARQGCRREAIACGIPTMARVDRDAPSDGRVTYPVPANAQHVSAHLLRRERIKRVIAGEQQTPADGHRPTVATPRTVAEPAWVARARTHRPAGRR